jgi:outer membrane receptor protein involved in Fe transport
MTSRAATGRPFIAALVLALAAGGALAPVAARAQAAGQPGGGGGLDEVIVTATRRAERLQDVPISLSVFSQEKIDAEGLKNIDDLTRMTPGVLFSRNGMGSTGNYNDENSDINIRGIDSSAGSSTTGIYIDDTPIQTRHVGFGSINAFPALFDVDRVETLRGPQGTLFGGGAEGGALRFITPAAGLNEYSGYARAEVASTEYGAASYEAGAAVGGPIIDGVLGFRASASYRHDGGWVDRVDWTRPDPADPLSLPVYAGTTEANANWQKTATARFALKWQVNGSVTIEPSLYYQTLYINDTAAYWQPLSNPSAGVYRDGNALTNPSDDPFYVSAVRLQADLGFAALTANTSYLSRDQHSTSDYTQYNRATYAYLGDLPNIYPQPGDGGYSPFADEQHDFFQEVRLASTDATARVSWTAGLFFGHTDENVTEYEYDPTLDAEYRAYAGEPANQCLGQPIACPGGLIFYNPIDRNVEQQLAAFGEVNVRLLDTVKATVGLRVARDRVTGSVTEGGSSFGPAIVGEVASTTETPVTPKFGLSYQPARDQLYYLTAAKGYRSGGVNVGVGSICNQNLQALGLPPGPGGIYQVPESYQSDSLWSYELGSKLSLFDRRLQVNSSVYVVNWRNIQQSVYLFECGEEFTGNLGSVRSEGGDIEVTYRPLDALTLGVTASYTDARYTSSSCAGTLVYQGHACVGTVDGQATSAAPIVTAGDALPISPWSINLSAEYATALGWLGGKLGYVRVDYERTTAQTALLPSQDDNNALFDTTLPGLPQTRNLQLRTGLRFSGVDLSLFANNLTNDHPSLFVSRDIDDNCNTGAPCGPPVTDNLYFARGVRPRTVGLTATYRY